jgi:hypothetical protein
MLSKQKVTHKLRATLFTDVKGYSLLLSDYAVSTLRNINFYREVMADSIEEI